MSSDDPLGRPLRKLLELADGWHDGEGRQVDPAAVEWGRDFAAELESERVSALSVFPTLEGGLLLEAQTEQRRWSLEVDPGGDAFVTVVLGPGEVSDIEVETVAEAVESFQGFDG